MTNLSNRQSTATTAIAPSRSSRTRSASRAMTSPTIASLKPGRPGASGAPALSANGCEARHAFWPHGHEKATACLARKQLDFEGQRRIVAARLWHFDIPDGIPRQADLAVKSTAADQFRLSD